ncbi:unnamed protein product [Lactuca saligna]|uniref:Uncharacterized protein n=1 Tax=Lactuca saligna TaxID=75948 RepID=A0AA35Z9H2_LACSI|nr:unnamed protein product [Lactuca saligna]
MDFHSINFLYALSLGSVMRETNGGGERSATAAPANGGVTNHENALRQSRGSEVLVVPIRILVLPFEASRSSMGVLFPVVTEEGAFLCSSFPKLGLDFSENFHNFTFPWSRSCSGMEFGGRR